MNAINEAVQLLQRRRAEAQKQLKELNDEVARIDQALKSLQPEAPTPAEFMAGGVSLFPMPSDTPFTFKDLVMHTLESEPRPFTVDELYNAVVQAGAQGKRSEEQVRNTIRSALFNLRGENRVKSIGKGLNIATMHDPDDLL